MKRLRTYTGRPGRPSTVAQQDVAALRRVLPAIEGAIPDYNAALAKARGHAQPSPVGMLAASIAKLNLTSRVHRDLRSWPTFRSLLETARSKEAIEVSEALMEFISARTASAAQPNVRDAKAATHPGGIDTAAPPRRSEMTSAKADNAKADKDSVADRTQGGRPRFRSPRPHAKSFFGAARLALLDHLIEDIIAGKRTLLSGGPGVGKTEISLQALRSNLIMEHFDNRTIFVSLASASSASAFKVAMCFQLRCEDFDEALDWLAARPAVIVLDNLETPLQSDESATCGILEDLFSRPNIAVMASIRGIHAAVFGGAIFDRVQDLNMSLLEPEESIQMYLSHAGRATEELSGAEKEAWTTLSASLGGVPLAISLLAKGARRTAISNVLSEWNRLGIQSLDEPWERAIRYSYDSPLLRPCPDAQQLARVVACLPHGLNRRHLDGRVFDHNFDYKSAKKLGSNGAGRARYALRKLEQSGLVTDMYSRVDMLPPVRSEMRRNCASMSSDALVDNKIARKIAESSVVFADLFDESVVISSVNNMSSVLKEIDGVGVSAAMADAANFDDMFDELLATRASREEDADAWHDLVASFINARLRIARAANFVGELPRWLLQLDAADLRFSALSALEEYLELGGCFHHAKVVANQMRKSSSSSEERETSADILAQLELLTGSIEGARLLLRRMLADSSDSDPRRAAIRFHILARTYEEENDFMGALSVIQDACDKLRLVRVEHGRTGEVASPDPALALVFVKSLWGIAAKAYYVLDDLAPLFNQILRVKEKLIGPTRIAFTSLWDAVPFMRLQADTDAQILLEERAQRVSLSTSDPAEQAAALVVLAQLTTNEATADRHLAQALAVLEDAGSAKLITRVQAAALHIHRQRAR